MNLQKQKKVLLLLPNNNNKFLAKWQGKMAYNHQESRKSHCEIKMSDKGNWRQMCHINLLKKWRDKEKEKEETVYWTNEKNYRTPSGEKNKQRNNMEKC